MHRTHRATSPCTIAAKACSIDRKGWLRQEHSETRRIHRSRENQSRLVASSFFFFFVTPSNLRVDSNLVEHRIAQVSYAHLYLLAGIYDKPTVPVAAIVDPRKVKDIEMLSMDYCFADERTPQFCTHDDIE